MSAPGLRSLLVVMGAGTFQIWRPTTCAGLGFKRAGEPLVYAGYENALRDAWETVVARLQAEAVTVGAHGVLGVAVTQSWMVQNAMLLQLQLIGTAVRLRDRPPLPRPFLSTLSMEEFLKLLVGGWVPCGITWGVSAVHVHGYDASPVVQGAALSNTEMAVPTAAVLVTRSSLEEQARTNLARCGAEGAVQVVLEMQRTSQLCGGGNGVLIDGLILGTGVVRYRDPVAGPHVAVPLDQGGPR